MNKKRLIELLNNTITNDDKQKIELTETYNHSLGMVEGSTMLAKELLRRLGADDEEELINPRSRFTSRRKF